MYNIFAPNSRIGASVFRRLFVAADVAPVHQIRSELHQPAQYPCIRRDFVDANIQCSGKTSHESHRAFDDSEPALPTSSCVSVPGCPAQESPVLQSRRGIQCPSTHGAPFQNHHEHPVSCVANSHHVPSRRTCTMTCKVDVCSCALCVRFQSVVLAHECFLPAELPSSTLVSPSSMSSSSVSPFNSTSFTALFALNALSHSDCFSQRSPNCGLTFLLAWTCLPRSLLLPSKCWFAAVKRHLLPLFPSVCDLIDCVNFHGLVLNWRSGT